LQPLFDKFGNRPLRDVTTADLVAVCAPVIKRVPVTGVRMCQRIRRVFAQALDDKLIDADPAVSLHKNKRLRAPKRGDDNHFAALPWAEVPQFIEALHALPADRIGASARAALEFVVLTATRTQETLLAQWDEFDLTAKTWTIPVARTKTRARHVVPLSDRVMALLAEVRPLSKGEGYVFPSPRIKRRPLSTMALLMAIRRLKYHDRTTAHGFRSSFSTWAYERTNWREEVIESALAHVGGNAVKRAYLRSDFMDDRRALMQSWSDHATGKASAKVVSIKRRTRASANR
jgi:integrase